MENALTTLMLDVDDMGWHKFQITWEAVVMKLDMIFLRHGGKEGTWSPALPPWFEMQSIMS
jgi:hypothetical protein